MRPYFLRWVLIPTKSVICIRLPQGLA
jgi:hypothetical protein